ncbi:MAG: hypothetical protein AB7I04_14985 [Pseudomonadales bacterium]
MKHLHFEYPDADAPAAANEDMIRSVADALHRFAAVNACSAVTISRVSPAPWKQTVQRLTSSG